MIWTLRRILVLIVLASTIAVVGTLFWVTATYQRFAIETQNDVTSDMVTYLIHQRVRDNYLKKVVPFVDEWSRLPTFVQGMQDRSESIASLVAERMMYTLEVTSGRVRLRNVVVYDADFEFVAQADRGSQESVRSRASLMRRLKSQDLQQRRVIDTFLWQGGDGRPLHSIIAPVGGFRVVGFIEFITDPLPELSGLSEVLGGTFKLLDFNGGEQFVDNVRRDENILPTDPANLETLRVTLEDDTGKIWGIASLTRDTSAFKSSVFTLRNQAVSIVAMVVIASVLFGWLLLRLSVFRQLSTLATAMEALTHGKTDIVAPETGPDEFSTIAIALDSLKSAVAERQMAEEQLQIVIDNSPVGVTIEVDDGVRWFVNQRQVENFRAASKEELLDTDTSISFVDPADRARLQDLTDENGRNAYAGEIVRRRRLDGSLWWASMTKVPFDLRGRPAEIVWLQDITETIESQRSAKLLTEAIENFPDVVALFDREEQVVFTNNSYHNVYPDAPPKDEILGWKMEDLLVRQLQTGKVGDPRAASDPQGWLDATVEQRRNLPDYDGEASHPDGRIYEVRHRRTDEGGMILLESDITGRKRAEERLRRREEELQTVIDNMPVGIAVFDPRKNLNLWNTTYCTLLGMDHAALSQNTQYEDFAAFSARHFEYPENRLSRPFKEILDESIFPETRWMGEVTHSPADRHVQGITQPIEGFGWIRILIDVTERMKAEQLVRESQERLRAIIDNSPDAIYLKDVEGHYTLVNRAIAERQGFTPESMVGKTVHDHFDADIAGQISEHEKEVIVSGFVIDREYEITVPGGDPYIGLMTKFPVVASDGEVTGVGTITHNITAIKRAEQAAEEARLLAEEANRAKSDFLSSMSHELRTPLNAIIGFSEFVAEDQDSPISDEQQECISQVLDAGNHLLNLIDEVLDLAKIEAGAMSLSLEPVSVSLLIDECLSLTYSLAAQRKIALNDMSHDIRHLSIVADRIRFKQVLLNLISNALKYNNEDGEVSIEAAKTDDEIVRINVSDTGDGIEAERLANIFDPFDRLGAENSEVEGTGIGLTITKRLVEEMGGTIGVESTVGVGTTFWVEFPASAEVDATISDETPDSLSASYGLEAKVLYVEDNPTNIDLVRKIMSRQAGIDLLDVTTAEEGIERALEVLPDVILMDINLPGMSGYDALEKLSDLPETRHIPVIALTAAATDVDIKKGQSAGFFAYLTKPIQARKLLETIEEALNPVHSSQAMRVAANDLRKVLVVDDLEVNLAVARRQLNKLGIDGDTESDPAKGLARILTGEYVLALVDINMPGMSGFDLAEKVRAAEAESGHYTPILALTASYGSADDMRRFREAGLDGHLSKPISLDELAGILRRWSVPEVADITEQGDVEQAAEQPPIDLKQLGEILGVEDRAEFIDLLLMFVDYFPEALTSLEDALRSGDRTQISIAAHAAKSASSNAAARVLSDILHAIETQAETDDMEKIEQAVEDVSAEFDRIKEFCRTYAEG